MTDYLLDSVEVTAHNPAFLDRKINDAIAVVLDRAMAEGRHGILVTQHSYNRYTVALSPEVPYGRTYERSELGPELDN